MTMAVVRTYNLNHHPMQLFYHAIMSFATNTWHI